MAYSVFTVQVPADQNASDGAPGLTLATRIIIGVAGEVLGIRWRFPNTLPSGTVTGLLYSYTGTNLLASEDFSSPVAGAWNTTLFAASEPVLAAAEVFGAVWTPDRYVATGGFFNGTSVTNQDLTAPADDPNDHNGQFHVGSTPAYPTSSFNGGAYFADIVFEPQGAVTVVAVVVTGTTTVHAPTVAAGANPAPAVVTGATTIHAPTPSASSRATPAVVAGTTTVHAPTPAASSQATPATVAGATTVHAPTPAASSRATPAVVTGTTTIHAPTAAAGAAIGAVTVTGVATVFAATAATGIQITPTTVTGATTVGTVDVTSPTIVTPTTVTGTTTVAGGVVIAGIVVAPTTVTGTTTIPTPVIAIPDTTPRAVLVASMIGPTLTATLG